MHKCYDEFIMFYVVTLPMNAARNCLCPGNPTEPNVDHLNEYGTTPENFKPVQKPRKRCCPYQFDGSMCRVVGDRLLCGFDRNIGNPNSDGEEMLKNGCRLKGNRLECGYFEGPFTNPPRPLDWNYPIETTTDHEIIELSTYRQEKLVGDSQNSVTHHVQNQGKNICRRLLI